MSGDQNPAPIDNPQALHDFEKQNIELLLVNNFIRPVNSITTALSILKETAFNYSEELVLHREFELKMRDGNYSIEDLQQHLDSLVALRQRLIATTAEKFKHLQQQSA